MWKMQLTSLNRKVNPISSRLGGRKFFLPRTMKEPTVRYSPVGAVFDTCRKSKACHCAQEVAMRCSDGAALDACRMQ